MVCQPGSGKFSQKFLYEPTDQSKIPGYIKVMNDLQMARGNVPGGFNLAVGENVILQNLLEFPAVACLTPFQYPTMDGLPDLLKELQILHPDSEIVVTNGAKQALTATFYAYSELANRVNVYHEPPYWPSYPTVTWLAGSYWGNHASSVKCITAPNNPDGSQQDAACDVWDSVYASELYGWNGKIPIHHVRICSASKSLGLSGLRVGWIVTKDPAMAQQVKKYVEISTSGVSVNSQTVLAHTLRYFRHHPEKLAKAYKEARQQMANNDNAFRHFLGSEMDDIQGVAAGGAGMFAYFKPRDLETFSHALVEAKVALVTGQACGEPAPGYFRMNMAHNNDFTSQALERIAKCL